MSNLSRRLHKLEAQLTDISGLVPNSPAWLAYWMPKIRAYGQDDKPPKQRFPLEAVRAWMQADPDSE